MLVDGARSDHPRESTGRITRALESPACSLWLPAERLQLLQFKYILLKFFFPCLLWSRWSFSESPWSLCALIRSHIIIPIYSILDYNTINVAVFALWHRWHSKSFTIYWNMLNPHCKIIMHHKEEFYFGKKLTCINIVTCKNLNFTVEVYCRDKNTEEYWTYNLSYDRDVCWHSNVVDYRKSLWYQHCII